MTILRRWLYRRGFRPKEGSLLFSPGLAAVYEFNDVWDSVLDVIRNSKENPNGA